jgi:hypothetical protein
VLSPEHDYAREIRLQEVPDVRQSHRESDASAVTAPAEKVKRCKDCETGWVLAGNAPPRPGKPRATPYPGPRCKSHHYLKRAADRKRAHGRHIEKTKGITSVQYDALYEAQGRVCAGCKRATGTARRLAVDHDHALARLHAHPHEQACALCVRGLLCSRCNDVMAHVRDSPELLVGMANYLIEPPAVQVIRHTASCTLST